MNAVAENVVEARFDQRTKVGGRKDAEHQEQTIELEKVRANLDELLDLNAKLALASAAYSDAIKATAEASGLLASTVRSYVSARASDKFEERERKVQQLALVFDELGGGA